MIKSDKDILLGYIEELLLSEKDIVVLSDDNDIININVNGRSFFLYIKSLTYAGNPYPLNTTRAQLPRRDDFKSIKDSNAIFIFLGYDEENEVFACWEPQKTKARLNEKQYVSFFSRLHLQVIAKEKDFVKTSLQNGLKYVLFRLDILPKFLLTIDDFFPDLISFGLPETPEINQGKIFDLEDDNSIVSFIEELYKNDTNESILFLVSSCINKFGKTYYNMTLRDWQILVSEYIEQKHPSISEGDEIEEKITDQIDVVDKSYGGNDNNSRLLVDFLENEVFPESSERFRDFLNKILSYPNFSLEETKDLFNRYYDGDQKAFDLLVKSNLKIVVSIACQFKNCGTSLEDLIQVGSMGLINAIKFYRNKDGANFNSYIRFGIYAYISDSALDLPYLLTLPARIVNEHIKYRRLYDEFVRKNDYPPSIYDIDLGEEVGIKRKIFLSQIPPDLRDTICFIEDYDSIEDTTNMPDEGLMEESQRIYIRSLLNNLSKRDNIFLSMYYGIGYPEETLDQIGEIYGLTRERVRQIVEKSRRKIKEHLGLLKKEKDDDKRKGEGGNHVNNKKKNVKKENSSWQNLTSINHKINHYKEEDCILRVLQKTPWFIRRSAMDISKQIEREEGVYIDPESVKLSLQKMPHIDCVKGKYKLVENTVPKRNQKDSAILYKKSSQVKLPNELAQTSPTEKSLIFPNNPPSPSNYSSSTSLLELRNCGLLTRKECKHCHYKGLFTIGDVQQKIQKYNLTPDSSRFTKHTINLWFKIVGFLESSPIKDSVKDITDIIQPNPQDNNLEDSYVKYFLKIDSIRQSKNNGHTSIAKPVLLLAIIDGITEGEIKNNQVTLNEWLEGKYNSLMTSFSRQSKITPINMPFWHLESDGFWHLIILKGKTRYVTPTIRWLKENVLYASLDDELWFLLQKDEWRNKLRNFIISNKL